MWVSERIQDDGYKYRDDWSPYGFVEAYKIRGKRIRYKKDALWECPDYQFILPSVMKIEEKVVDMEAFITFLGIWYSRQKVLTPRSGKPDHKALAPRSGNPDQMVR